MDKIQVMVNGLPGKMATEVARYAANCEGMELWPFSLTGHEVTEKRAYPCKGEMLELVRPEDREEWMQTGPGCLMSDVGILSVDYTHPSAANANAEFYCKHKLNFVMGTTGGDRQAMEDAVRKSDVCAVIAPNMAKPVVMMQAMMEYAAHNFPNALKGYTLAIRESHQKGKADTSGTAKSMVAYFNKLGIPFTIEQIIMIREPEAQLAMGVPKENLGGHGWHTYTLRSDDNTVLLEFTHDVNGRSVYAEGTLDAIRFLDKKVKEGNHGKVYSMIDVLKG